MFETIRSVFALLLSYGLLLLAGGLFTTLLGLRTTHEGFATETVGFIMAGHFLGLFIGAFACVRVVNAVGHIRAFATFASVISVVALTHVLVVVPIAWFMLRVCSGICMAGMVVVTESWLNERASNVNRGQVMAFYMITNYMAAGSGQLIIPLGNPASFELFCIVSIIFSLALVPVLMTRATAPAPSPPRRMNIGELWRVSPLGVLGAMTAGLVSSSFYGLGAVFSDSIGLTIRQTSFFMASVILGGLLFQWHIGRISDAIDRRWVIMGVSFCTALSGVAIVIASASAGLPLFIIAVIYGGFSFTLYSISAAHTNDFTDPKRRMQTASSLLTAYACGAVTGPIVAAFVMKSVGPTGLFLTNTVVLFSLGFFALYRMQRRKAPSETERAEIINLPGGQFTSGQLYASLRDQRDRDIARVHSWRH